VAESSTICGSRSRRPVRKLLDTPLYMTPLRRNRLRSSLNYRLTPQESTVKDSYFVRFIGLHFV